MYFIGATTLLNIVIASQLAYSAVNYMDSVTFCGKTCHTVMQLAAGAGSVIALMTTLGVIDTAITTLVPVGSMLIANAMNTNGLALNRFRSEVLAHIGEVETALALGADAEEQRRPYVPGVLRGQPDPRHRLPALPRHRLDPRPDGGHAPLRHANPVYAAIYQFVVLAMIFASSGLTSLVGTMLIRGRIFSPAEQLLLAREG